MILKFIRSVANRRIMAVGVYGAINILPRLTSVFLVFLYTRIFSLTEYGTFGVFSGLVGLLSITVDLGIPQAILRGYYDHQKDPLAARRYLADAITSAGTLSLVAFPTLMLLALTAFWMLASDPATYFPCVALALSISFVERASSTLGITIRALEAPLMYAVGPAVEALGTIICGVAFVVILEWSVPGALFAVLVGKLASFLAYRLLVTFRLGISRGKLDWRLLQQGLSFGLPLIPSRLAGWGRGAALRPILTQVTTLASVGLFSLASSVAALPLLLTAAIDLFLVPHYFKRRAEAASGFTVRVESFAAIYLAALAPIWAALVLFSPELLRIFAGSRFESASGPCGVLLCVSFIRAQLSFLSRQLQYNRQTKTLSLISIPCAVVSVGLALLLVPLFGITAAAWGALFSEALCYVGLALAIQATERVHHPIGTMLFFSFTLSLLAAWNVLNDNIVPAAGELAIKLLVVLAVAAVSWFVWLRPNWTFISQLMRG